MTAGPVIARVGEIQATSTTVRTPVGEFPLQGSEWTVTDQWFTEQRTPRWAILLAIAGIPVTAFSSLLFLRVRQTVSRGVVQVGVRNGPYRYTARIPVTGPGQVQAVHHEVSYLHSIARL